MSAGRPRIPIGGIAGYLRCTDADDFDDPRVIRLASDICGAGIPSRYEWLSRLSCRL